MKIVYTRYMENFVRSAMAPDTIVAEVAQNTVWKMRNPSIGSPLSMIFAIASISKKCGAPTNPPVPNIKPNPIIQNNNEPKMKSTKFFIRILAVFFERVNPASTRAKPGCMKNTSIAANNIHTVLMPVDRLLMASELTLASVAGASCAQRAVGTRNNKVKANLRHDFFVPLNIVVVIMFYNVFEDVVRVIMLYVLFLCE